MIRRRQGRNTVQAAQLAQMHRAIDASLPTTGTALLPHAAHLDMLFDAALLCEVCEEHPWTQPARWHPALICAACASMEPEPEEP